MKFCSILSAAALAQASISSAFLLTADHPQLKDLGYVRIDFESKSVKTGFFNSGSWLSLKLDNTTSVVESTGDLGRMVMRQVKDSWFKIGFDITGPAGVDDILAGYAIESGNFFWEARPGGVWHFCGKAPNFELFMSTGELNVKNCYSDVILKAVQ